MINHTTTHRELTVYSLHPYYFYEIRVAAVTVGPGPFSMATVVQTQQDSKFTEEYIKLKLT